MTPAPRAHQYRKAAAAIALALSALAAGCTVLGPEYKEPTADVQSTWTELETSTLKTEPPLDPRWWKSAFSDPELDRLIESALAQNLSLRSAALRVLRSRQQLAIAIGEQYPQSQYLSGSAESKKLSRNASDNIPLLEDSFGLFSLGFNLSWEVDFWGRYKLAVRSAAASLDASVADYDGVMITLLADVAQSYLQIRTVQEQIRVAQFNLKLQEESARITSAKFDAGAVSSLDVEQAETLLYNTRAQLVAAERSLQQVKNSLAVLLGRTPQGLNDLLTDIRPIPSTPAEIAIGVPQELIRRRPDIRAAERQLAAQSAQIGIAISELYPQFTIGGSIVSSATTLGGKSVSELFKGDSVGFNLFGVFQWNIFNYGRLKSNVRLQDATFQQLLVDYRETVLQAQGEVENAIVAYVKGRQLLNNYQSAAAAAQRAVTVSTAQYEDGLVDFNTVLSTLGALRQQQDLVASTQGAVASSLVQVYKSLGGGWQIRDDQAPDALLPASTTEEMLDRTDYWRGILK